MPRRNDPGRDWSWNHQCSGRIREQPHYQQALKWKQLVQRPIPHFRILDQLKVKFQICSEVNYRRCKIWTLLRTASKAFYFSSHIDHRNVDFLRLLGVTTFLFLFFFLKHGLCVCREICPNGFHGFKSWEKKYFTLLGSICLDTMLQNVPIISNYDFFLNKQRSGLI